MHQRPLDDSPLARPTPLENNALAVELITRYLDYCGEVVKSVVERSSEFGLSGSFSQIGDDLVITPEELVELVDKVQVALDKVD